MLTQTIGFIGAGQMARALGQGFQVAELIPGERIVAWDPVPEAGQAFTQVVRGSAIAASNAEVVKRADVVFLAVKPQSMPAVMNELAGKIDGKLVVSIAAGVTINRLCEGLKIGRVVRVMPNTPALVGHGASAYALGPGATPADGQLVGKLVGAVGR